METESIVIILFVLTILVVGVLILIKLDKSQNFEEGFEQRLSTYSDEKLERMAKSYTPICFYHFFPFDPNFGMSLQSSLSFQIYLKIKEEIEKRKKIKEV